MITEDSGLERTSSHQAKARRALSHALLGTHEGMYILDGAYSAHVSAAMHDNLKETAVSCTDRTSNVFAVSGSF